MGRVGRFLSVFVVAMLVVAVWAILVAPDFDLDPTLLQGKMVLSWLACAGIALALVLRCLARLRQRRRRDTLPEILSSLLEMNCAWLC